MRTCLALLILCSAAFAGDARISSSQLQLKGDNVVNVKVGQPPIVDLFITDPPENARQTWDGPLGKNEVGRLTVDGVCVSTSLPGEYHFRCVVQVPLPEFDDVEILDITVVVDGAAPKPEPPPDPPQPQLTELGKLMKTIGDKIESPTRAADAQLIASCFSEMLAMTALDDQSLLDGVAAKLKSKLTDAQKSAWEPWRTVYITTLTIMQAAGTLNVRQAFTEIAAGLRAVQ